MPRSKRILDLVAASLGLLILSPIILVLAVLVRIFIGSPVIFRQERPGYREMPFYPLQVSHHDRRARRG